MSTEPPAAPRLRVAGILQRDGEILLVRHEKAGESYWMLPGGGVDPGETLATALVREWEEELCLHVVPGALAAVVDAVDPAGQRHVVTLAFHLDYAEGEPRLGCDPRIVEAAWHPLAALDTLPMRPPWGGALRVVLEGAPAGAAYLGNFWVD